MSAIRSQLMSFDNRTEETGIEDGLGDHCVERKHP